jgi:translation initiation factor IF-1
MVKNKFGGNRHKKMARKNIHTGPIQRKTRYSTHPDEIYACCNQIFGGGQIKVICLDGTEMLCFIRNKFRGRGKRDNIVKVGTWLLVGKRGFETVAKKSKLSKSDLLEVYNDYDKENLEQNVMNVDWSVFKYVGVVEDIVKDDGTIEFTENIPDLVEEEHGVSGAGRVDDGNKVDKGGADVSGGKVEQMSIFGEMSDDEIDIDDI